jgi:hypothetical protein
MFCHSHVELKYKRCSFKVHVSDGQSDENSSHDPLVHNQTEIFMKENRRKMAAKACMTFFQGGKKNQQSE